MSRMEEGGTRSCPGVSSPGEQTDKLPSFVLCTWAVTKDSIETRRSIDVDPIRGCIMPHKMCTYYHFEKFLTGQN